MRVCGSNGVMVMVVVVLRVIQSTAGVMRQ